MNEVTVKIHESNLDLFNAKLDELNKMFAKKNLPLISCSMTEEEIEETLSDSEISFRFNGQYHPWAEYRKYTLYTAHLTSDFNQTNLKGIDCNFEGVVSLVDMNENDKVYTFKNISYSSFLTDCKCDECNKKIGRNKYIVFSKTEEVKSREDLIVLGTSCAKNYFPFDIERYFGFLESAFEELGGFDEYDGEYSFGNGNSKYKELSDVYYATCRMSDNLKIYKKEGETKSDVIFIMNNENEKIAKNSSKTYGELYPIPSSIVDFSDFTTYIEESYNKNDLFNDFDVNARSVFFKTDDNGNRTLRKYIDEKYIGIVIWGFFSAKKNHDRLVEKKIAEEKRMAENAKIEYFGAIGDKFEKELTFEKIFSYETHFSYYGEVSYILIFSDDEGHKFKWSTSCGTYKCWHKTNGKDAFLEYEVGKKYILKGSIKAHEEYKGCKQTVITRCKVLGDGCENHVFNLKDVIKEEVKSDNNYKDPFENLIDTMEEVEQSA